MRKDLNYLRQLILEKWSKMQINIYFSSENNSPHKGLRMLIHLRHSIHTLEVIEIKKARSMNI